MNKPIHEIPEQTMAALVAWPWPGNVRELENFLERAVILTPGSTLRAPLAELENQRNKVDITDLNLHAAEREHILRVLREAKGMIGGTGGAAEKLGLKRTTLNSKLRKLGIRRDMTTLSEASLFPDSQHRASATADHVERDTAFEVLEPV